MSECVRGSVVHGISRLGDLFLVRLADDAKSAFLLSGAFAAAAVCTVPLLLPSLPAEARDLPLPLEVFCAVLAVQLTAVYGLFALGGLRLARRIHMEPAPILTHLWKVPAPVAGNRGTLFAIGLGLGCGVLLVAAVAVVQRTLPGTLPGTLHPPGIAVALVASTAGALGEEILWRLLVLTLLLWIFPKRRVGVAGAILVSAVAFGAAHAPAFVFLFGGWSQVPAVSWIWLIGLNGLCGAAYGLSYVRWGIEAAVLAHFATDVVWHAASQWQYG